MFGVVSVLGVRKAERLWAEAVVGVFFCAFFCVADTFIHKESGEILHGFATQKQIGGRVVVRTEEKGFRRLDLSQYDISRDYQGRREEAVWICIKGDIEYEAETAAFEKALSDAVNKGPYVVVIEIDSCGGRVDLAVRMCEAIIRADNCQIAAFVSGGGYGGAYSSAAAAALACEKIYMAENTAIGAATLYVRSDAGPMDIESFYGKDEGHEALVAFSGFFGTLAANRGRPWVLASAMVDKEMEVLEVVEEGRRDFIWPNYQKTAEQLAQRGLDANQIVEVLKKKREGSVIRTWSKQGSLLTLSAPDAIKCGIADGMVNSRTELLGVLKADGVRILIDKTAANARAEVEEAKIRIRRAIASADYRMKQLRAAKSRDYTKSVLTKIILELRDAVKLAESKPDLAYLAAELKPYLEYFDSVAEEVNHGR
ncbi:MAG: hypothetical protein ABIG61_13130 [Planctomycetota bacterium]